MQSTPSGPGLPLDPTGSHVNQIGGQGSSHALALSRGGCATTYRRGTRTAAGGRSRRAGALALASRATIAGSARLYEEGPQVAVVRVKTGRVRHCALSATAGDGARLTCRHRAVNGQPPAPIILRANGVVEQPDIFGTSGGMVPELR
jgi:hypothetical protein